MPPAIPEFAGNGGQLAEYDWSGKILWEYRDPYLSHCFAPLANGNVLVAKWRAVPAAIAARVKGGQPGTERKGEMYGEAIQEISRDGRVLWEWLSFGHLDPDVDVIGPLHPRDRWTNLNSLFEMPDGNILLFDNGAHRAYTTIDFSRVIEVDPRSNRIVWEYKDNPVFDFSSFICSGAQRTPRGTTVICECTKGRLFEVTVEGDIVWEYLNPFYYEHPIFGTNNMVFRCIRYDPAHPALANADLDPKRYLDFNALVPKRFVRSPRSRAPLRNTYGH
jgi:hypothetical protein